MIKITKSRFALIISMLMLIALTSCEKEEAVVGQDENSAEVDQEFSGSLIRVTGETSGSGMTKTTLEGLEAWWKGADEHGLNADKVGIYSPKARTKTSGGDPINNAEFTAYTSGKSSEFAGEMYWGTGDHDFYAYYPYDEGNDSEWWTSVPISLASEQTQSEGDDSDHLGALDFMVATPLTGIEPVGDAGDETSGVNFRYNHVFTLLEFQITGTGDLTKVKLSGSGALAFGGGTIDITQETPGKGVSYTIDSMDDESGEVTITFITPVDLSGESVSVYMMINPGEHSGDLTIGLEIDGDYKYMTKSPPEGGFERGKKYEVPLDYVPPITFTYRGEEVTYGIVEGANGRLWMDRNLGASQVATSSTDALAYGDLLQWGRLDDGHQDRESGTTETLSPTDVPGHGDFILKQFAPRDWRDGQNDDLWQGDGGINDVCPAGWRVPTETEFIEELESWSSNDAAGAFASPLKLPVAGGRNYGNGSLFSVGSDGKYWSSTVHGDNSRHMHIGSISAYVPSSFRGCGYSVRCIKDN